MKNGNSKKNGITRETVAQAIAEQGGATFTPAGAIVSFAGGYQVSKHDGDIIPISEIGRITAAARKMAERCGAGEFVGVWADGGAVCVDISERVNNRARALRLAVARNQKAVFGWKEGASLDRNGNIIE